MAAHVFFSARPPCQAIEQEVIDIEEKVQAMLERKFQAWIDEKAIVEEAAKTPTLAFLGVVDSIMLELVYGGNDEKRLKEKLEASWTVFWRGIAHP